jgi:hypothetical protein
MQLRTGIGVNLADMAAVAIQTLPKHAEGGIVAPQMGKQSSYRIADSSQYSCVCSEHRKMWDGKHLQAEQPVGERQG